jgi:predicted metallopeptidase
MNSILIELARMIFGPLATREQVETIRHEMHHFDLE